MTEPLYRRLLGPDYALLPGAIQDMHDVHDSLTAHGFARIERGTGPVVGLLGWLFGFPPAGENVAVTVVFTTTPRHEVWDRSFAGRRFYSTQELGTGRREGLLIERFGPMAFAMAVTVRDGKLHLNLSGGWCLGVPLPSFALPKIEVFEHDGDDRFNFHVDLALPMLGRLVRYRGWLVPEASGGG